MTHRHENRYADLMRTTHKRVVSYSERCVCGAVRRVDNRVPRGDWTGGVTDAGEGEVERVCGAVRIADLGGDGGGADVHSCR